MEMSLFVGRVKEILMSVGLLDLIDEIGGFFSEEWEGVS